MDATTATSRATQNAKRRHSQSRDIDDSLQLRDVMVRAKKQDGIAARRLRPAMI
jgi:hypothetical protein